MPPKTSRRFLTATLALPACRSKLAEVSRQGEELSAIFPVRHRISRLAERRNCRAVEGALRHVRQHARARIRPGMAKRDEAAT